MNIIDLLKKNEDARKIFGKRELKIIEKQLMGLNLSQSEKNRLSRDIRKKLEFIKELCRFSDEFNLKKGSRIREIVEDAKEVILEDYSDKINEIILFGSAVENKLSFRSDIDIAVKFKETDVKQATLFRKSISGKVNPKVDVQVYNILPEKIKKEIDLKGKILFKK